METAPYQKPRGKGMKRGTEEVNLGPQPMAPTVFFPVKPNGPQPDFLSL